MPSSDIIFDQLLLKPTTNDEIALSNSLNNIGVFLSISGKLDDALHFLKRSANLRSGISFTEMNECENHNNKLEVAKCLEDAIKEESRLGNEIRNSQMNCMTLEMFDNYLSYGSTQCYTQHITMNNDQGFSNDKSDIATIIYNMGLLFHKKSFTHRAKATFINALTLISNTDSLDLAALIHDNIGEIEYNNGDKEESFHHFAAALTLKEQSRLSADHKSIANTLVNMGRIHYYNEEFDQAMELLLKAHSIITKSNYDNVLDIAIITYNVAMIFSKNGQYQEAINCYKCSLTQIESQLGKRCIQVATILRSIGMTFLEMEEIRESFFYLSQSVRVGKITIGGGYVVAESLLTLAYHLENENKHDMALKYYHESLDLKRSILGRTHEEIIEVLCKIGIIYDSKCEFAKSKDVYEEIRYITKTIPLSSDQGSFLVSILVAIGKINLMDSKIHEAMGNFSEALSIINSLGHQNVETYALDLIQSVLPYAFCITAISA